MTTGQSTTALSRLSDQLRGRLLVSGDADWDTARGAWNTRVDQHPAAIVEAEGAGDLAAAAAFAAAQGLRVTVQSTGHGAGTNLDGTIMVRTSGLRDITVDQARNRVTVGPGVRARDLAAALPPGLAASLGSGPTTGVIGFTLFGGAGMLGRAVGFMAHKVVSADVITADGALLRCDAGAHRDLWWALRGGGGGGYALVTRLELQLDRVPELFGGQVIWPGAAAPDVFNAWRDWTAGMPPEMSSSVGLISPPPLPQVPEPLRGKRVATLTACYVGPAERGAALLSELTAQIPAPIANACRPLSPADLGNLWNAPDRPMPSRVRGELLRGLPDEAIGDLLGLAGLEPESPITVAEVRHLGGRFSEDPPEDAALGRCDAPYQLETIGLAVTPEADEAIGNVQQALAIALGPWGTGMTLPGFAQTPQDTAERRYPPATRERLRQVKDRYDPSGVILPW